MNQNTSNSGLALKWPHPLLLAHWMRWRNHPRISTFDYGWYWTPRSDCQQEMEMRETTPAESIMLNSRGERCQRLWEGLENEQTSRNIPGVKPEGLSARIHQAIFNASTYDLIRVSLEEYCPRMTTSFNLIPCIITFDLIRNKCYYVDDIVNLIVFE